MTSKGYIKEARKEFEETGTLCVTTFMELNNNGIDADILLAQFEGEKSNGE